MLTTAQKNAIYNELQKVFTVSSTSFTLSCVYQNQFNPERVSYPMMIINFIETGQEVDDLETDGLNSCSLSINIIGIDNDNRGSSGEFINGQMLVEDITRQLMNSINASFNSDATLLSNGVRLLNKVRDSRDLSDIASTNHVFRRQMDISLIYEPS